MSGTQRSSVQPENFSSTSNCVFDFLPFFGSTHIRPVFAGCGASLASTSNLSSAGVPCDERDVFFERLFGAEQIGERDERRFVFRQQNHAAGLEIRAGGRWLR